MSETEQKDFAELNPDRVIDAVESLGFISDMRVFALNSYDTLNAHIPTQHP
ncbi:MAG: hypothetical protein P1U47_17220 [Zhongshania sp.]|uniref:hypothetical protein n=1 Tax=Zhongshania sp. TaxID=1971902 RepID=UPI00261FEF92|nr:hypothetical protein [Zhongshania sp.]MDF1694114.1 hypothetical protein [Zhongshania sp.]